MLRIFTAAPMREPSRVIYRWTRDIRDEELSIFGHGRYARDTRRCNEVREMRNNSTRSLNILSLSRVRTLVDADRPRILRVSSEAPFARFRLRNDASRDRRVDSHGRRRLPPQSVTRKRGAGRRGALDSTANRGSRSKEREREPNTRGHGSFRRLLSSIISPARGRPRVVSPREESLLPLLPH